MQSHATVAVIRHTVIVVARSTRWDECCLHFPLAVARNGSWLSWSAPTHSNGKVYQWCCAAQVQSPTFCRTTVALIMTSTGACAKASHADIEVQRQILWTRLEQAELISKVH